MQQNICVYIILRAVIFSKIDFFNHTCTSSSRQLLYSLKYTNEQNVPKLYIVSIICICGKRIRIREEVGRTLMSQNITVLIKSETTAAWTGQSFFYIKSFIS